MTIDISWEETFDLLGEWFGLGAAVNIEAHTPRGETFLQSFRGGGVYHHMGKKKMVLYPTKTGETVSSHMLEVAAHLEGIKVHIWRDETKPSLYFQLMEKYLGKDISDLAQGKYEGEPTSS